MATWSAGIKGATRRVGQVIGAAREVRYLFIFAMIAVGAMEIFVATQLDKETALRFLLLNLILGGAAGFSGGLLGFIFGVPRALTDGKPGPKEDNGNGTRTNTNLEQISDWLTKILVGAGLTSLSSLPEFAARSIGFLDNNAYQGLPGGGTFAVFLFVYFFAAGFLWSYIETRTTLTDLFEKSERQGGKR
jgi:hypothetical protein